MKVVIQRVKSACVTVEEEVVGEIEKGLMVLVGVTHTDTKKEVEYIAKKICNMRIFADENDKMNLNVSQVEGKILLVSQFTLYADCTDGNRPSFIEAAEPTMALELYEYLCEKCGEFGIEIQKGVFGASMKVDIVNDGPITIVLEK